MAQTLLLGLGGTGSSIVNSVAAELKKKNISINDGQICCAVLDTNENDSKTIKGMGVGIPVIPTSKDRIIKDYLKMYSNKGVSSWMPESPTLLKSSMKDGAGQMRYKSRLAFFDTVEDRTIQELERHINKMFDKRDDSKIRVMIVSSLAGGTGSGMFIQTALWLRKFFAKRKCTVTIRGIFLLPDIFIKTIKDINEDDTEIQSLYANAYGAIRELNAITKIKQKGMVPTLPVKIDGLFDSDKECGEGDPVFDYAFFVDDISEGGSVLNQMDQYHQLVARLVYMQLYAPMHTDLYSEEDNLFKRFEKCTEPVFGSCGTAKAVYPTGDILRYCALRASQESLSTGWRKIDEEIAAKQRKEDEKIDNGVILTQRINPRKEYVRLFEAKAQKTGEQVGKDRLFLTIANDVKNERKVTTEDGDISVEYSDKIDDLIDMIDNLIAATVDTSNPGSLNELQVNKAWKEKTTDTREKLIKFVEDKVKNVKRFIDATDESVDALAEEILDLVCPSDMGDINPENAASVFGFLTKKDKNNETYFVHPIAVRYLLYKLASKLDDIKEEIELDSARQCAEKGYGNGKAQIKFDNPKTGEVEVDAVSYLKSKALFQNEESFVKYFKSLYAQHNKGQHELCRAYAIASVKLKFAIVLSQRLEKLIKIVEEFFKNLEKVSNTLNDAVVANVSKNEKIVEKILYVCASEENKKDLYKSLHMDTGSSDTDVNKITVQALYSQFCAQENPDAENNKEYVGQNVENTFFREIIKSYSKYILEKHKGDIDLDIYTAVCKSADFEYEKTKDSKEKDDDSERLDIDLETGESTVENSKQQRYYDAMCTLTENLSRLSAPFLISDDEQPEEADEHLIDEVDESEYDDEEYEDKATFTPIKKRKTFWGFNPTVSQKCPELGTILGVDVNKQANHAYLKNEFDCYRAVYGIPAGYVEKFNELKNGEYYTSYRKVVREMIAGVGAGHTAELVHTPHLDKTWHLFLPYITPEKQLQEDNKFYRLFWLALAYGMISLDNKDKFQIARTKKTATGQYQKNETIMYKGREVGKSDVLELLAALEFDGAFLVDAARLEKKFTGECEDLDNYEGTEFLRGKVIRETKSKTDGETTKTTVGGLASKRDNNAVTVIVRYHNSPRHDDDVTSMLIQSLEKLCCELVEGKYERNETEKVKNVGYELCKRIYTASGMENKDIELISHWKEAWSKSKRED